MLYQARGKKVKQGAGYMLVYCPEYPEAKLNGYVLEHRLVMANYLERPLKSEEHVHHINGNKKDNRIENLEIVSNSEHRKEHWKSHTQKDIERLTKISRERAKKIKIPRKLIPCACGCGEMIWNYTDHGRPKKYVQGHNQRENLGGGNRMNRSKIEYTDYTWNPITGCRHHCEYCYVRKMSKRFAGNIMLNKMAKKDYSLVPSADGGGDLYLLDTPMINETGSLLIYPFGFEPTFHRYRVDSLSKLKMGNIIFVGAMCDMFGSWVPDEWIKEIFNTCMNYPIHNYLFLTKNPKRYIELAHSEVGLPVQKNMWYGSTITNPHTQFYRAEGINTFLSIEPLFEPFGEMRNSIQQSPPNWVIIGAETGRRKDKIIPQKEWIEDIVEWCENSKIPVFMKDSLIPIVGEDNMRREFPETLQHLQVSPKMEKKLYDICAECKTYLKKSDMITMLARSKRGEQPKQFCFLCKDCFKQFCEKRALELPALKELINN